MKLSWTSANPDRTDQNQEKFAVNVRYLVRASIHDVTFERGPHWKSKVDGVDRATASHGTQPQPAAGQQPVPFVARQPILDRRRKSAGIRTFFSATIRRNSLFLLISRAKLAPSSIP